MTANISHPSVDRRSADDSSHWWGSTLGNVDIADDPHVRRGDDRRVVRSGAGQHR